MRAFVARSAGNVLLGAALLGLAAGWVLHLVSAPAAGDVVWSVVTAAGLGPAVWWVIESLRRRQAGVDLVAVLALVGALAVGEPLAGAVITVMLATGRTLEARANARASRELHALLARAPRTAHRDDGGQLADCAVDQVVPGDLLHVLAGEVVPVDGRIESPLAVLDESALTGEPRPIERPTGEAVASGVVNAGGPFRLRATASAADSAYAGILRLVRQAQATSAPFVRLANRYAGWFVPVTLLLAGSAWLATGEAVRAVAVLVVATPCPLLLAAPIAISAGLSRAARRGVIVKGGGTLERLARGGTLLLDKTGTLTAGRPTVTRVVPRDGRGADEVLGITASLEQVSPHVFATAVVRAAKARDLPLTMPCDVIEEQGHGVRGRVAGQLVAVGSAGWVAAANPPWVRRVRRQAALDDASVVFVAIDGALAGALLLTDLIRPDAGSTIRRLRRAGIRRMVLVTGDRAEVADTVGGALGLDEVLAERSPAEKLDVVRLENRRDCTIMVGDGINDAPALAAAGVGVALGGRRSTASSEAADVVLAVDRIERLGEVIVIARRARRIALQSVVLGMALAFVGMGAAALGYLPPVAGALAQEGIDVLAILSALRALGSGRDRGPQLTGADADLTGEFLHQHHQLRGGVEQLRAVADDLDCPPPRDAVSRLRQVHRFLVDELLPHEETEERQLYPVIARALGGDDPTATMVRVHVEIRHLVDRLGRVLGELGTDEPDPADCTEIQRLLYGLHAVLRLHFAQEEENYFTLADHRRADAHVPD